MRITLTVFHFYGGQQKRFTYTQVLSCILVYKDIFVAVLVQVRSQLFSYSISNFLTLSSLLAGMSAMVLVSKITEMSILQGIQVYVGNRCQICEECTGFFAFDGMGWSMCCLSCHQVFHDSTLSFGGPRICNTLDGSVYCFWGSSITVSLRVAEIMMESM